MCSCERRDESPEKSDVIYIDLQKEFDLMEKQLAGAEVEHLVKIDDYKNVIPQSGQKKPYEKKLFDSENTLKRLRQQKQFFQISSEQRKDYVRMRYNEGFGKSGRPWPDTKEIEQFERAKKLQREKITWEKNKGVIKNVPRGTTDEKTDK